MRINKRIHKGDLWWFADFDAYQSFGIGRVRKMPTLADAMRIVHAWRLLVIDGRPYYFDKWKTLTWKAYGT